MFRFAIALALVAVATAARQRGPDIPNFPTPQPAVEQMLEMAGVTKADTVFDLGCGDGRIVVTAAKRFGAHGVGVDIDPNCVTRSKEAASTAGVQDLVTILHEDLFKTDISRATVVALYLSPDLNVRVRPKLLSELRPGSRVVSHVYDMGDWRPDRSEPARGSKQYRVFLWTIPARVAGEWRWSMRTARGLQSDSLRVVQTYQKLSGTLTIAGRPAPITAGAVHGDRLELRAVAASGADYRFEGVVQRGRVQGRMTVGAGPLTTGYACTLERER